ncbi:putative AraC-family transcriptional regulator [Actinoplanes missouriensis 431]|uniref:HTH-type transcriptional regulator RipA n=1 Tax=Actinoplanes missouriensis (strain ATCC 14538 / DSM 43046 / CBS 188.64 / JCM 3121 / NBRC 102363 / NCIMB 12654 / NRRL B-3342 / UNCC 431) TaxID=512565 RepID=I0H9J3_ACTM4|nr:AraC family transcriptional regulator [Actinoplanes missouriensis]BAL89680.1 putative AraC-family transcriptional regulator [Actinoplanes missouriensis 431]
MVLPVSDDLSLGTWRRDPGTVVRRAVSAPAGDPASPAIVAESEAPGVATDWLPHAHPMHELVWVRGGTLTTRIGNRIHTVPPGFGLWLPAGVIHGGRLTAAAELHDAFFAPDRTPVTFDGPTSITMTPLLESLLFRLARTDLGVAARARTEAVVFDVLEAADRQFALELPGDPRIDPIAEALLADPADDRGLQEWAAHLGLSDRTITRAFREATGLSFAQWRQALRIHEALALLSAGAEVGAVSERLGYAQPSTFIAAFRRVMNVTPGLLTPRA